MTSKARELCRLPFLCVDVAVRLTTLVNAVLVMRQPILDGHKVARAAGQVRMTPEASRRLAEAWRSVRAQIAEAIRIHERSRQAMPAPTSAVEALRADAARFSAKVLSDWLSALDAEDAKRGPAAALGAMLEQADRIARRITTSDACPPALVAAVPMPNLDHLSAGDRAGTIYWLNVDGQDLVVLERAPVSSTQSSLSAAPKELA